MSESNGAEKIKVWTTFPPMPLPPNSARSSIRTERLILKPFSADDLAAMHELRTQPEVMINTAIGRGDRDLAETQQTLDRYLPPKDLETYNYTIRLAATDELIGTGGMHTMSTFGWPEVGYMLKREFWGRGYASEFLRAWLDNWWKLPRSRVELEVDARTVDAADVEVTERVCAHIEISNGASRTVLNKAGFRLFTEWLVPNSHEGASGNVTLAGYMVLATHPSGGVV
jgi:RimJ/RimL family protein N-acetyltransferase